MWRVHIVQYMHFHEVQVYYTPTIQLNGQYVDVILRKNPLPSLFIHTPIKLLVSGMYSQDSITPVSVLHMNLLTGSSSLGPVPSHSTVTSPLSGSYSYCWSVKCTLHILLSACGGVTGGGVYYISHT